MGDDAVERLDALACQAQGLLLRADVDRDQQRLPRFQELPALAQHLREQRHLEDAARIRHLHEGEAVAARRGTLLAADDDAGELEAGGAAAGQPRRQIGIAHHADALQALAVGVERMAREIKADGVELLLQALDGRPVLHRRQRPAAGGSGWRWSAVHSRRKTWSLSVWPMSSVIRAARSSPG